MGFLYKTFGGLKASYYIRHFFFGALISSFLVYMSMQNPSGMKVGNVIFFIINALLYPYARFVYEQIIGFIIGENIFYINTTVMLMAKLITMGLCWAFSIFIAPVGLIYLYYYHSKAERQF
ncbi:hypothetical protein [Photorhabdus tasmaniensis]|uniref:Uncharacterized protein n=1 Tax=Photorhabdus tasmaniensis TaxID=1004159 RepID=A0ABX0GE45_9GAMM|nr:hypothetical protein [Photorhabdus tasmaniensis]NHB86588.1 hypothetical protein [Photorhabdus tasmaniensis]